MARVITTASLLRDQSVDDQNVIVDNKMKQEQVECRPGSPRCEAEGSFKNFCWLVGLIRSVERLAGCVVEERLEDQVS